MQINREILNVIMISWGYALLSSIVSWFYVFPDDETWDCAKSQIIFEISFVICTLLAPSYVILAGTRFSMLTSYTCYIFYIICVFWPQPKLFYAASATLGFGGTLLFVSQGQCLTENKSPRKIHFYAWIFWFFYQISRYFCTLMVRHFPPEIRAKDVELVQFMLRFYLLMGVIASNSTIILLLYSSKKYFPGGLECIPNEKVVSPEEPDGGLFLAWKPLKDLLVLVVNPKMILLFIMLSYTGLMNNLRYKRSPNITDTDDIFNKYMDDSITLGEIIGALLSLFCCFNKKGDSTMIIFMGLVMLTVSFSFGSTNVLQNGDNFWVNPQNLSCKELNDFGKFAKVKKFFFGIGDACFHTQIYSLIGALFSKNPAPAFALAGLYYWVGYIFGYNYITNWPLDHQQLRFFFGTGILAFIFAAMVEILYVDRRSNIDTKKESLKTKETAMKNTKEIPPEIKLLYAEFNKGEKQEELPISITIPEAKIISGE